MIKAKDKERLLKEGYSEEEIIALPKGWKLVEYVSPPAFEWERELSTEEFQVIDSIAMRLYGNDKD